MTLDTRIDTVVPPMFGCHSDLDKYRKEIRTECDYRPYYPERACDGCLRLQDKEELDCAEEQTLEYFDRYIAGDRK